MTPGARYQAAIDLLDRLSETLMPLDRVFAIWAKEHRFAGSKDRRAIKETLFQVMRWRGRLKSAAGAEDGRSLVLAYLGRQDDVDADVLATFFDGTGYNPSPLTPADRSVFDRSKAIAAFDFDPLPDWLEDSEWQLASGTSLTNELRAMSKRAPLDLRVNTLKASPEEVSAWFETQNIDVSSMRPSSLAFRVQTDADQGSYVNLRDSALFKEGKIEFQDLSTQIASALIDARPKMQVLDMCAGAGGKTLALAASMENQGQVFATDVVESRLSELRRRSERAGIRNVQVRTISDWAPDSDVPDPDFSGQVQAFDRVVLDVPCSGSGVWRRSPDNKWRLTRQSLHDYEGQQASLLRRGAALVKPGGRLVYITCSLLKSENSKQIQRFIGGHAEFSKLPVRDVWATVPTLDASALGTIIQPQSDGSLLLTPESANTDGCFVAVLERQCGKTD